MVRADSDRLVGPGGTAAERLRTEALAATDAEEAVVVDGRFGTSRVPVDLPAFNSGVSEVLGLPEATAHIATTARYPGRGAATAPRPTTPPAFGHRRTQPVSRSRLQNG